MQPEDKRIKLQFWTRESLYREALAIAPNHGDFSNLMREGLELGIAAWKKRQRELRSQQTEPTEITDVTQIVTR